MFKLKERYFIKIVPQRGDVVHRFQATRRHVVTACAATLVIVLGSLIFGLVQVARAHAEVTRLQSVATKQKQQLQSIGTVTATIRAQLRSVERQNQQIQQLIGVRPRSIDAPRQPILQKTSRIVPAVGLDALAAQTAQTAWESHELGRVVLRVLNVRRLGELARARMVAAIPSIDPVDGAPIVGCFCYRSAPSSEFHPGVDLGADLGQVVHAAAAGSVASAGWDGGYGLKLDIDHGNGYHTWYAHLSRIDVQPGAYVHKGEPVGLVGETGFATGPHLHYQVMLNGTAIDPAPYLNGVPPKALASLP